MQRDREKRTFLGWIRRLVFVLPVWRKLSMVAASCQMLFGEPAASANLRAQPTHVTFCFQENAARAQIFCCDGVTDLSRWRAKRSAATNACSFHRLTLCTASASEQKKREKAPCSCWAKFQSAAARGRHSQQLCLTCLVYFFLTKSKNHTSG